MNKKFKSCVALFSAVLVSLSLTGCFQDAPEPANTAIKGEPAVKYTADFNGHSYEYLQEDLTWEEARDECIRRGGHLVTVTSAEEQEFLKSLYLNINGDDTGGWLGAYSDGYYGGNTEDWFWVTGEEWSYTNWDANEPSNSRGEEWFAHFWKEMTWNDVANDDPKNSQVGFICEYDDLSDEIADGGINDDYVDENGNVYVNGGEEVDVSDDWESALESAVEEADPFYKDLGDGRTAIQSSWRGVQIKYPNSFDANEDGDALHVCDGDAMHVYARNITAEAEEHSGDLAAFCAAKAEEQAATDFTKLFGMPEGTLDVNREGGDGDKRICVVTGNIWNDTADMHFKSKVFISGKNDDFIVIYTAFWRLDDQTGADHFSQVKVTSWGRGEMYN